ncbi:DUF1571 domain-containing protein [Tautonia plasticadhaerens]|uniref:DUF1571 domain-containing protein n=1 Tax=Tautonia plasticadhaerens TaxID=2527974 RepID=A0A518GYJ4_9BACT|nr:DUF1571 domain-containing protein [Tautonia plasticadhaerens]QDV33669.1 hypothetical protein ElP_15450 [Tautonia plasticadhaerens]
MTSGQDAARRRNRPRALTRAAALAALAAVLPGCAQLQQGWRDRIGVDRRGATAPVPSIPETPAVVSSDPYAARVGLDDGKPRASWSAIRDRTDLTDAGPGPSRSMAMIEPSAHPEASVPLPPPDQPTPVPASPAAAPLPAPASPAPVVSGTETSTTGPLAPPQDGLDAIEGVLDRGIARLESMRNYRVSLERQERVRGTLQDAETVTLNVRTDPFAVRLEWPEGPSKGREVLYSEVECDGLMHVKMGKTLIPIPPMQLEPTSPIALSNARHPITEAGLRHILEQTKDQVAAARSGDSAIGTFSRLDPHVPDGFEVPCIEILRETPEGDHWRLVVEESTGLPVLLEATDADGQLLESYRFRDLRPDPVELDEPGAFDPAVRFARGPARPDPQESGTDEAG